MIAVYPIEDVEHLTDHNGRVLPHTYLMPKRTTAHQFAYIIHTELGERSKRPRQTQNRRRRILKDRDVISIIRTQKRA